MLGHAVIVGIAARKTSERIPELALCDASSVAACPITGLGARKLLALQRTSRRGTEPAVDAVVSALRQRPRGSPA